MTRTPPVCRRLLALFGVVGFVAASALIGVSADVAVAPPAHAQESPIVLGAGSTWSQNAIDQWRADVARFGLRIEYQGQGSTAGRRLYASEGVDWAVSEIPFQPDEAVTRPFTYMPIVAGGTALMYNLTAGANKVTNLRLSPETIAKIFTCKITNWNDPQIKAENGGAEFPSQLIKPVVRSDGSGTTAQFTAFLKAVAPAAYTAAITSFFPAETFTCTAAQAVPLSDGVANYVHNESTGSGAITYVETSYAIQRGRPVAALRNASGNYTLPTSANVATALTAAVINADRTQNLNGVYANPDPAAYAMSSYSYAIMPTSATGPFTAAKGNALGRFAIYFVCDGQRKAESLGYSPLPPNLQQIAFEAMKEIPGAPPPPSMEDCQRAGATSAAAQNPDGTVPGSAGGGGTTQQTVAPTVDPNATTANGSGSLDPGLDGSEQALGAPQRVRLAGGEGSGFPLALAGVGLLALVLVPPIAAGLVMARRTRVPIAATAAAGAAVAAGEVGAGASEAAGERRKWWQGAKPPAAAPPGADGPPTPGPGAVPLPGLEVDAVGVESSSVAVESLPAVVPAAVPAARRFWPRRTPPTPPTPVASDPAVADATDPTAAKGSADESVQQSPNRKLWQRTPAVGAAAFAGAEVLDQDLEAEAPGELVDVAGNGDEAHTPTDNPSRDDPMTAEVVMVEDP